MAQYQNFLVYIDYFFQSSTDNKYYARILYDNTEYFVLNNYYQLGKHIHETITVRASLLDEDRTVTNPAYGSRPARDVVVSMAITNPITKGTSESARSLFKKPEILA